MKKFLIFCSGVHPSFLKRSPSETNKYLGIGATVFFTGLLAWFSSAYAFYTVFNSYLVSIGLGLIWGLMIFNLDRYIVSSIKKLQSPGRQLLMTIPRLIFAGLIALVISKPIELKLFQSEIDGEIALMEQQKQREQEELIETRYLNQEKRLQEEISSYQTKISEKENLRNQYSTAAAEEADGTGGSKRRNLGPIYLVKKAQEETAEAELEATRAQFLPLISAKMTGLNQLQNQRKKELDDLQRVELSGFASRIRAMSNLADKYPEIGIASLFITLLFLALETAPIFVKLISSAGPLDLVQDRHEAEYRFNHARQLSKLSQLSQYQKTTAKHFNLKLIEAENILINKLIDDELSKAREKEQSFDTLQTWRNRIAAFFA